MVGTAINVATVVTGGLIGTFLGARLPENTQRSVMHGLGLLTLVIGIQMAMKTENVLVILGALLVGVIVGEGLQLQAGLERFGSRLQTLFRAGPHSTVSEGFVTASLVFCVGPMAILGSLQDGLSGDFNLLAVKSMLDGFAAVAFSASLGWGVLLSAGSILLYQGSITLLASGLDKILTPEMITEISAAGGLLIAAIGLKLLNVKDIRIANFLPALAVAPAIVALLPLFKAWWPW
ncbi:MAG: DUF554 domain-containing protein [Desulfacinum sp.]|nr:DUF554 domain-containing protein [Desulfacinum sp.]